MSETGFLKKYQENIMLLPLFLLAFGAGICDNKVMMLGLFMHLIICYVYKEPLTGAMWKSKLYKTGWIFCGVFLGSMVIAWFFNHGDFNEITRYFSRMLPFLLFGIMAKADRHTAATIWLGLLCGLLYLCIDTYTHYNFVAHRLTGSFAMPIGLASVLVTLLPFAIFGTARALKKHFIVGLIGLAISLTALHFMLLTGSRGALLTLGYIFIVYLLCLALFKDWRKIIFLGIVLFIALGSGLFFNYNTIFTRMHNDVYRDGRVYLYQVSCAMFKEHPIVGVGVKQWGAVYKEKYELKGKESGIKSPHNIYLQSVNENGLIGLAGFIALLAFQFKHLFKAFLLSKNMASSKLRWVTGVMLSIMTILVYGLFDYAFFGRYVMTLFWLFWGLGVFLIQYEEKQAGEDHA